jgi:hypothetical protein
MDDERAIAEVLEFLSLLMHSRDNYDRTAPQSYRRRDHDDAAGD